MIRIVTDSTCEAPAAVLQHPAVTVVPLYVLFGKEALKDKVEISQEQFWQRLPTSNPLPTTSQPTPADFLAPFRAFTEAGDEVIAVVLSSRLSGTHNSAIQAKADLPWQPVDVVDSATTSVGLGIVVGEALRMAEAGVPRATIVATLESMRARVHFLFALDTLEYLARGGRIGKAQAFMGSALSFKPLLTITEGEIVGSSRVRGRRKALESLVELQGRTISERGPQVRVGVTHASAPDEAAAVSSELCKLFQTQDSFIAELGPVLGTHTGPGAIATAVYAPV